jgi:hypothetical protein
MTGEASRRSRCRSQARAVHAVAASRNDHNQVVVSQLPVVLTTVGFCYVVPDSIAGYDQDPLTHVLGTQSANYIIHYFDSFRDDVRRDM